MSLPGGYKRLEYIQSSGTQYIDTGFKPNQNTSIIVDATVRAVGSAQNGGAGILFGSANPVLENGYEAYVYDKTFYAIYNNTFQTATTSFSGGERLKVEFRKNVCTVAMNGAQIFTATFEQTTFSSTVNLTLLKLPRTSSFYGSCALYSAQIYDGTMLIRDFIPCKNASETVGLWDDVNGVFYGSAGTGAFIAGPEVKGTHETLIDGTAYGIQLGRCLIGGTGYEVKKGRVLIDGTGYDIELSATNIWIVNQTLAWVPSNDNILGEFVSNGETFNGIRGGTDVLYYLQQAAIGYSMKTVYQSGAWVSQQYRTMVFAEAPTDRMFTWLQQNAIKQ